MGLKRATFASLARAAIITGVDLRVGGEAAGAWAGTRSETECGSHLRRLRLLPRTTWSLTLRIRIHLEDASRCSTTVEWNPEERPDLRRLVACGLARRTEQSRGNPQACREAHRFLELLEGRSLLDLHAPGTPLHLRQAIKDVAAPHPCGAYRQPCRRCSLQVYHDALSLAVDPHFLPTGLPCRAPLENRPVASRLPGRGARHPMPPGGGQLALSARGAT